MSLFGSIKNTILAPIKIKKRVFDPEKMSIEDISLPSSIINIDNERIRDMIKEEVSTFKALDYRNKPLEQIKAKEYHSYQIGILLKYLKGDNVYAITNIDTILPTFVIGTTKRQLHTKVFDVVYRYDIGVDKDSRIDELKKEIKWTPLDAAYLLYYLSLTERTVPKRR